MGQPPVSASTPRCTICPLVGPTGRSQAEPLAHGRRPGAAGDGQRPAVDVRAPSTSTDRRGARPSTARRPRRAPRPRRTRRPVPPRPGAARPPCPARRPGPRPGACSARWTGPSGGKSAAASAAVISDTSPGERRRASSAKGANQPSSCGAQADGEDPAARRTRPPLDVGAVRGQPRQQGRVVRTAPGAGRATARRSVSVLVAGERMPAPASVARPGCAGVDDGDARAQARQLVGERQADQAGADDGHVAALPVHGHRVHQARPAVPAVRHTERRAGACGRPTSGSPTCPGSPSNRATRRCPTALRMHYVDEGPADAETVLLLHGQPTWSYLYRTVVARLVEHGLRAVAPDLVGFGRSDKPLARTAHSVQAHVDWMAQFADAVGLADVTLVVQDWGGPIGLGAAGGAARPRAPASSPPTRRCTPPTPPGRAGWPGRATPARDGTVTVAQMLLDYQRLTQELTPFRPEPLRAGGHRVGGARRRPGGLRRAVPRRVLLRRAAPAAAADGPDARQRVRPPEPPHAATRWRASTARSSRRSPTATRAPAAGPRCCRSTCPARPASAHVTIAGAGHFLQEDRGAELADVVAAFVGDTPPADLRGGRRTPRARLPGQRVERLGLGRARCPAAP